MLAFLAWSLPLEVEIWWNHLDSPCWVRTRVSPRVPFVPQGFFLGPLMSHIPPCENSSTSPQSVASLQMTSNSLSTPSPLTILPSPNLINCLNNLAIPGCTANYLRPNQDKSEAILNTCRATLQKQKKKLLLTHLLLPGLKKNISIGVNSRLYPFVWPWLNRQNISPWCPSLFSFAESLIPLITSRLWTQLHCESQTAAPSPTSHSRISVSHG